MAGHSKQLGRAGLYKACLLDTPLFETTVSRVLLVSAILVSDYSCFMLVHSIIILELFLPKLLLLLSNLPVRHWKAYTKGPSLYKVLTYSQGT